MHITIGKDALNQKPYNVDPKPHLTAVGATGVGKSSTLEHLFIEFLKSGNGGLFLDIHGDTADRLLRLIPTSRHRDLIWFDPDADFVPAFNPLSFTNPEQMELAKETCLTLLKSLSGSDSAWGNETPHNIRMALDAVTELVEHPTLVHAFRFIVDEDYRNSLLGQSQNPFLRLFKKQFNKLSAKDQASKLAPATNKMAKLMRPNILPVIGAPISLDPLKVMNEGRIMICRISKGRLGEETAMLLYSLIVSLFSISAMQREKQTERLPFMIVADEAQNAIHGGRFGTLLAEARKYGISLVTAFQGSYQMPIMGDILTNAGTQIIFNASGEDAELFAKNWRTEHVNPEHITDLSRYEFYSRTFKGNQPIATKVDALPALKPRRANADRLIRISLQIWGTDKAETRNMVNKFMQHERIWRVAGHTLN